MLLAQAIERSGVDARAIFADAGMDLDTAADPETRFPVRYVTRAWALAVERSADPCLPLRLAQHFQPQNVGAIGVAITLSTTVMDALQRCVRYARIATEGAVLSLQEDGDTVILRTDLPAPLRPFASGYSIEAFMAILVKLFRQIAGEDFAPQRLDFHFPRGVGIDEFSDYFRCPVHFGQIGTAMRFDRQRLMQACNPTQHALALVLDQWMSDYLAKLDAHSVVDQLRIFLIERIPSGKVTLADAARHLAVSERSLQRKLAEENLSFADLRDDCRRHLAEQMVREGMLALAEVAFVLGFSDQSSFNRSFRRWTSMSPRQFVARTPSSE